MPTTKIYIGSDHAGFKLKTILEEYLKKAGYTVVDLGPSAYDEDDDYPDYIIPVAQKVAKDKGCKGIVLGGSGQGESLAANKVKGIRAVVYYGGSMKIVTLSREHNDANVLSLGARFVSAQEAKRAVKLWLETPFSEEARHTRRLRKIAKYEQ
ncbi:ribose-5-phosphate isomerase [Candidatus Woesearchaeota archaeon]|nr:ribose-5-phosphate isomerase [Candidatus Woesearchaeota archaeon]